MKQITKIEANAKSTDKKLRVAAYARVSTSSEEQLISLEAQKTYYEKLIKSRADWEYAGLYYDEGISGTKMDKRDGLLSMLSDCEKGLIDYIIVKSILEEDLHRAIVMAANQAYEAKAAVIPMLMDNIKSVLGGDIEKKIKTIDDKLSNLQMELIKVSGDEKAVENLGGEIISLREEWQELLKQAAERKDLQIKMQELADFLNHQDSAITEYDEALVRRLVDKVIIHDNKVTVILKSRLEMDVEI